MISLFILYLTFCANDRCATVTTGETMPLSLCQQRAETADREYHVKEIECREVRFSI